MKWFLFLLSFSALAQFTPTDRQYSGNLNELINPSFTQGKTGWTATGTGASFTITSTGAVYPGSKAALVSFSSSPTTAKFYQVLTATSNIDQQYLSVWATTTSSTLRVGAFVNGIETVGINLNGNGQPNLYTFPFVGKVNREIRVYPTATTTGTVALSEAYLGVAGNLKQQVDVVGEWIDYTPVFTGFGTVTNVNCRYKLITDTALIQCKWTNGTVTAVEARVNLPIHNGVQLTTKSGVATSPAGTMASSNITGDNYFPLYQAGLSYLTFSRSNADSFASAIASARFNTGETEGFIATVPISNSPLTSSIYSAPAPQAAQIKWYNIANCAANTTSGSWTDLVDTDCTYAAAAKLGDAQSPTATGGLALKKQFYAGKWKLTVGGTFIDTSSNTACEYRLTDGVNIVGPFTNGAPSGGRAAADGVSQQVEYSTATVAEWKIQAARTSGTGECSALAADTTRAVWISAEPISGTMSASFENVVTTPGVSAPKLFSARVGDTGSVSNEIGDLFNGNCTNATPQVCTFTKPFTTSPNCQISWVEDSTSQLACQFTSYPSTTGISYRCNNNSNANVTTSIPKLITCHGE